MTTKGVASVRSPVCNLQLFDSSLNHEAFADSMVREFQREYGVTEEVNPILPMIIPDRRLIYR